ncbi:ATP-binding protein [Dyadobacter sp. CY356]|uniref:sensor histidine kinase n=1 Tax=Dyadobacter sp. CY356 TaxID=2906442 RepID=UPI001F18DEAF|nr:PAS domain-containing sensor histidine kinase [Dyadobacter sp. CY356]MCF0055985.1 PAS domain-containing sensor histidine kinase [Dyadobacter sp. CY356]
MKPDTTIPNIPDCGPICQARNTQHAASQAGLGEQVATFFSGLLDTNDWPARWYCGTWSDFHGWLYIISDLLIWAAYFLIPIFLLRLVILRKDFPFPKLVWLFGAFIVLCGTNHFVDAIIFWWPAYRLSAFIRLLTAVVSVTTVYALYRILPNVLLLRSVKELEHEINERRLVEEKLAASEFLLSEAGHVGRVGGWEFDVQKKQFNWSRTAYEIFGREVDYYIGPEESLSHFIKPHQQILRKTLEDAYEKGIGWDLELQLVTPDQSKKWVRYYGKPLFDQNGDLIKMRGVIMDIDKYKINELALSKSVDLMARQNTQLKNFTHILSHNLRNHSSNISMLTDIVDEKSLDDNNAEIFQKIKRVSFNLNETLNDLSNVIKIRESYLPGQELSFTATAEKVLNALDTGLKESNAVVNMNFEVDKILFPGIYLESIIMNLISNGIKYKKEKEDLHIELKTYLDKNQITIFEYTDNGLGIDLTLHGEKIFGLYKTFHHHKNANGVGLFLIKNQIESQGGKITVESKPNKGTKFKITFYEKN